MTKQELPKHYGKVVSVDNKTAPIKAVALKPPKQARFAMAMPKKMGKKAAC